MSSNISIIKNLSAALMLMLLLSGCATVSTNAPNAAPEVPAQQHKSPPEPLPPDEDILDDSIPELPAVKINTPYETYESKRYDFDLQTGNVVDILRALVKGSELGLIIEPGITSENIPIMDLKGVSLKEILDYILPPLNLKYRWEGKNLHVFRNPLISRYFTLDYLASTRKGSRKVSFSTRSGGMSGGGGGGSSGGGSMESGGGMSGAGGGGAASGGGMNQSSSEISVDYENTIWNTFTDSMKVLVFGTVDISEPAKGADSRQQKSSGEKVPEAFAYADKASGKKLLVSPATGIVMVTAFSEDMEKIGEFIDKFAGSSQRQVWIEAKIVEVNLSKGYQLGVDWAAVINRGGFIGNLAPKRTIPNPAMSFKPGAAELQTATSNAGVFQFGVTNHTIDMLLDAISRQGNLKVLASPRISTLNNEKAVIRVVREEVFFNLQTQISQGVGGNVTAPTINVQVVPVGIVMDILPQVGETGDITLSVNPDISELLEIRRFEVEGALATQPVIDRRSIDTVAKLKNGQTLVIAGIIKERTNEIIKGVPLLYKIPLLGNIFRRTEQEVQRTELVIFITPRLHSGKNAEELTEAERRRIKDAILPGRLGDVFPMKDAVEGELQPFKKKENKSSEIESE